MRLIEADLNNDMITLELEERDLDALDAPPAVSEDGIADLTRSIYARGQFPIRLTRVYGEVDRAIAEERFRANRNRETGGNPFAFYGGDGANLPAAPPTPNRLDGIYGTTIVRDNHTTPTAATTQTGTGGLPRDYVTIQNNGQVIRWTGNDAAEIFETR